MGESLEVHLEGWPRDAGRPAFLTRETDEKLTTPSKPTLRSEVSVDGVVRFRRLVRDARYTFAVPPSGRPEFNDDRDDLCALRSGVRASDSPLTLRSVVGKPLEVRVPRASKYRTVAGTARIEDLGVELVGETTSDGGDALLPFLVYRFRAVPDGEWTVRVWQFGTIGEGRSEQVEQLIGTARTAAGVIEIPVTVVPPRANDDR